MKELHLEEYLSTFHDHSVPENVPFPLMLSESQDFQLPQRNSVSHKYSYGRALIIGGAVGYSGAPVLAANACERSGAGLTQLFVPEAIYSIAAVKCDGAVVRPFSSTQSGTFSRDAFNSILPYLEHADACVIGPGLGLGVDTVALVDQILSNVTCPTVIDADALTICGEHPEFLKNCQAPIILTPHEGEFKRLGGDLSSGRLTGACSFSLSHPDAILILKGFGSLICKGLEITVNPTGSPAMAKGGSGDVLSGILCGLLVQGFDPLFSARCAVYLHGLAGDLARDDLGEYSVTPSDLIRFLPIAFQQICS